jgi:hypothetical protein
MGTGFGSIAWRTGDHVHIVGEFSERSVFLSSIESFEREHLDLPFVIVSSSTVFFNTNNASVRDGPMEVEYIRPNALAHNISSPTDTALTPAQ